ncbi:MAG: alcohol dehydrogenase (cytochrome c) [Gammaproteobacteria bacterium]|jgi:alcohol dehydrogenase (cytochrome c)
MSPLLLGGTALLAVLASTFGSVDIQPTSDTNWLSYNHNINGQRYVAIDQINKENVSKLGPVCQLKVDDIGSFHTSILHIDGLLYFTSAADTLAVDSADCSVKWRHHHKEQELEITTFRVNRGVAYANGVLYRGTVDGYLLAIDALTGKTVWQQQSGDPQFGEFFSAAPQVYQGLVIVGAAGSDWGMRGRVMAFDAQTGREVWRFYTIPRGDEEGAKTWINADSARTGGGGTWTTYTIDISAGELFIPVGNPAPDLLPEKRPGENLFTDSLVVLDIHTGKLKWYHQLLSNDSQDLDFAAAPTLYYNKKGERMVGFGSKDGYAYAINRETQQRVFKTEITTIKNSGVAPTVEGVEICPGVLGGVEWNGASYDKPNHALILGTVDWCNTLAVDPEYAHTPGGFAFGGTLEFLGDAKGWIHALDADTGAVRWERQTEGPMVAGITTTIAGLVFTGDLAGNFMALDSSTGAELYKAKASGGLAGGVITYLRDDKQYVAFVSGNVSRLTFGNAGSPTLNIYALDGNNVPPAVEPVAATSGAVGAPNASAGRITYGQVCAMCHGGQGEGAIGPKLQGIKDRMDHEKIVEWIKNPSDKMPKLYPSMLDEQKVIDVAAYLEKL